MHLDHLAAKLLVILLAGLVVAGACRKLGVSSLVGYLVVGAVISKYGLHFVSDEGHEVQHLAEAGVFFLLFSIGLELSLGELIRMAKWLVVGGGSQVLLVAVPAAFLLAYCGLNVKASILLSVAVAFSSTVLVFKGLAEWGQAGTRHGRRAMGILLFQDIALVPLLLVIPLLTKPPEDFRWMEVFQILGASLLFTAGIWYGRKLIAGLLIPHLASVRSTELLMLFSLVVLGGATWIAHKVGLPPTIGAFGAGLMLSDNRLSHQIDALILPFRETFATIFFISLGLLLDLWIFWREGLTLFPLLALAIVWKSVAGAAALRLTGLSWRTSLGMGLCLSQLGEFAFVVGSAALSAKIPLIDEPTYQRLLAVALGSLVLTPLLMPYGLRLAQRGLTDGDARVDSRSVPVDLIGRKALVIGIGPVGKQVALRLRDLGTEVSLIDLSPVNLYHFEQQGFRTTSGDASDPDVLRRMDGHLAPLVVVCVPHDPSALQVVKSVRELNRRCRIVVRCRYQGNMEGLIMAGAAAVVSEEHQASEALLKLLDLPSRTPVGAHPVGELFLDADNPARLDGGPRAEPLAELPPPV